MTPRDSAGSRMDTAKIITDSAGGYLAVYHTGDTVNLASSAAITAPSGRQAVVATMFIPSDGSAAGEAGELIHYSEFPAE